MKIQELIQILDEWAPPSYAEDFDNVGLLVGNNKNECKGFLITLDTIFESPILNCTFVSLDERYMSFSLS